MKLLVVKLVLCLPSITVLGLAWVSLWFSFVPLGPWPVTAAACVVGMLFGLSWGLVTVWGEISKFVNRHFGA